MFRILKSQISIVSKVISTNCTVYSQVQFGLCSRKNNITNWWNYETIKDIYMYFLFLFFWWILLKAVDLKMIQLYMMSNYTRNCTFMSQVNAEVNYIIPNIWITSVTTQLPDLILLCPPLPSDFIVAVDSPSEDASMVLANELERSE